MNDLTFFLMIFGIVFIILIAVFTYFKNKKNMEREVNGLSHHNDSIDDVLLSSQRSSSFSGKEKLATGDFPQSFTTKDDWIDNTRPVTVINAKTPSQTISISHMPLPEGVSDFVIAMSIQKDNHLFSGEEILAACKANNLLYGEMNIFHFPAESKASTYALFSMANMIEPGTFDINNMDSFSTPGVSLFMQLPLPMNCIEAYNKFVKQAKLLSQSLNADLYDEKFNILSPQIISHTLENINSFQREIMKAEKKKSKV